MNHMFGTMHVLHGRLYIDLLDSIPSPPLKVYLHTQLVAQLYAMTCKDPHEEAERIANNVSDDDSI